MAIWAPIIAGVKAALAAAKAKAIALAAKGASAIGLSSQTAAPIAVGGVAAKGVAKGATAGVVEAATGQVAKKGMISSLAKSVGSEIGEFMQHPIKNALKTVSGIDIGYTNPSEKLAGAVTDNSLGRKIVVPGPGGVPIMGMNQVSPSQSKLYNQVAQMPLENRTLGSSLGKFAQSMGYGIIDKPLPKNADTWDYLGRFLGQVARKNEGSGLGVGSAPAPWEAEQVASERPMTSQDFGAILNTIEPSAMEETNKAKLFQTLMKQYPNIDESKLKSYLWPKLGTIKTEDMNIF